MQPSAAEQTLRTQVCVLGAGIAGLTLAHRLIEQGVSVVLLEAGAAVDEEPARGFGGSSRVWGGQLLWPSSSDLAAWPIPLEEMEPYFRRVEQLLGVDALSCEGEAFFGAMGVPLKARPPVLRGVCVRVSKWTRFARRNLASTVGRVLEASPLAQIRLGWRATAFQDSPEAGRIEAVVAHDDAGKRLEVCAQQFVLAAGTVGSAQLLLRAGFGERLPALGKDFHDHLTVTAAELHGPARAWMLAEMRPWLHGATWHSLKFEADAALREELDLLPVLAHLVIEEDAASGLARLRELLRRRQQGARQQGWSLLQRLPLMMMEAVRFGWQAGVRRRRYVSAGARVTLQLNCAQQVPSASRIEVEGEPRRVIDDRESRTLQRFAAHLQTQYAQLGLEGFLWRKELLTGEGLAALLDNARHGMGGATMGDDPRTSVVCSALQVHGMENLSVASAAVFPNGSPQLPGLSLMALSLRLGDRLAALVGSSR